MSLDPAFDHRQRLETVQRRLGEQLITNAAKPTAGHVGEGNFHAFFIVDPTNHTEMARVHRIGDWITDKIFSFDA